MEGGGPPRPVGRIGVPMERRPRALAALFALTLTSCSGVGQSVETPVEGTLVLHTPASRSSSGHRFASTTIIFTTATEDLEGEPDQGLQVTVGTRTGNAPRVRNLTRIAKGTNRPLARILNAASFATLWRNVEAAGLFKLPRYPGSRVPEDANYILLKTGEEQRIYTRPRAATPSPEDKEKTTRLMGYWRDSKLAIVSFLNS